MLLVAQLDVQGADIGGNIAGGTVGHTGGDTGGNVTGGTLGRTGGDIGGSMLGPTGMTQVVTLLVAQLDVQSGNITSGTIRCTSGDTGDIDGGTIRCTGCDIGGNITHLDLQEVRRVTLMVA